jgi:benzoyl-CoA reductase/2-hydroxyglutaryl-CoA dehydratase subunit BcrC/BadD/HgdB
MNEQNSTVMSKVERYYKDYGIRARELKKEGKTVISYLCSLVPVEIITAAGLVPFRIRGNVNEPITKGDTNLETIACPFIRSCFDLSVKGWYDYTRTPLLSFYQCSPYSQRTVNGILYPRAQHL